jgi:IS5 family transposase
MAGLAIIKPAFNLPEEALCERRVENSYYQLFCDETFFRHDVPLRS